MDPNQTIAERQKTHGDFSDTAMIAQSLKTVMRMTNTFGSLEMTQKEVLDMIATKEARILSGDANFPEHWEDIAGYALLEAKRLRAPAAKPSRPPLAIHRPAGQGKGGESLPERPADEPIGVNSLSR